jgi:hypothetical protein
MMAGRDLMIKIQKMLSWITRNRTRNENAVQFSFSIPQRFAKINVDAQTQHGHCGYLFVFILQYSLLHISHSKEEDERQEQEQDVIKRTTR